MMEITVTRQNLDRQNLYRQNLDHQKYLSLIHI